jgi:hypothetical protein
MDRSELGTFLFASQHFGHDHAALAVLLGLNGIRVSEACTTNIEDLGFWDASASYPESALLTPYAEYEEVATAVSIDEGTGSLPPPWRGCRSRVECATHAGARTSGTSWSCPSNCRRLTCGTSEISGCMTIKSWDADSRDQSVVGYFVRRQRPNTQSV